jgi:membrane protein YdbS with pleckstrin-like domain
MNCVSCGAEVAANAVYCQKCGERVDASGFSEETSRLSDESLAGESARADEVHQPAAPVEVAASPAGRLRDAAPQRRAAAEDAEEELWVGGYSAKDMIGVWALDVLLTIGLLVAGFYFQQAALWWTILVIIVLIWGYPLLLLAYRRLSVRYRLTTQRFFHEKGILWHVTDRIEVIDMDDISFEQSIVQRLVNVGRIRITSSDRSHPELIIDGIADVRRVSNMMDDARRAERIRRGLHIEAV